MATRDRTKEARELARKLKGLPEVITKGFIYSSSDGVKRGLAYVSGRIQFASGQVVPAVLDISVRDQGEHCGSFVVLDGKLFDLHHRKTREFLERRGVKVFPYKYNYDPVIPGDFHVEGQPEIEELSEKQKKDLAKAIEEFESTGEIHQFV